MCTISKVYVKTVPVQYATMTLPFNNSNTAQMVLILKFITAVKHTAKNSTLLFCN